MSFSISGVQSMRNKDSLIPFSEDDPIMQMVEAFNGKDNKFSKAIFKGIKEYEKHAQSTLSVNPGWSEIAPYLSVTLSADGQSLSYSVQGDPDIEQKYMELEYGGPKNGAQGKVRAMANNGDSLAKIMDNALSEVMG